MFKLILALNLIAFIVMKIDKEKAKRHAYRIPEKTLFLLAIIGGSLGILLGMQIWRHKTKHRSFVLGIPCILILQILLLFISKLWF